jgi:hypothetical protein
LEGLLKGRKDEEGKKGQELLKKTFCPFLPSLSFLPSNLPPELHLDENELAIVA